MADLETNAAIETVWRIEAPKLIAGLARIVRDVGVADLVLGSGDSLPDRRLGLQECPRYLGDGEPGDQPQC